MQWKGVWFGGDTTKEDACPVTFLPHLYLTTFCVYNFPPLDGHESSEELTSQCTMRLVLWSSKEACA